MARLAGSLVLVATLCAAVASRAAAQEAVPSDAGFIEAQIDTAPVEIDGQVLFRVRGATSMPADVRAANIRRRIEAVADETSLPTSTLRAADADGLTWIRAGGRSLMAVTDADARMEQLTRAELALAHLGRIRQAIDEYRQSRSPESVERDLRDTIAATAGALLLAAFILVLSRLAHRLLSRTVERKVSAVRIQSVSLVQAERVGRALHQTLRVITGLALLVVLFEYLSFALGRFPVTRHLANNLIALVVDPLSTMGRAVVDQIPSLAFLAVLFVVSRIVLRVLRLIFDALGHGTVRLQGFEPEFAEPTYKIVRFALIAFVVVVAYPYLPGSQSEAFKGVSLFVGVLFSLGSSSAVSNLIAGYMLIYRRAFKVGDRVKIGDVVGDVTESRIQVTRLRTVKNEEIVIPNSQILTGHVVNYSALASTAGLILHTEVGIGYETPWRQVEAMLLEAADRTPGILKTPAPFVLQRALADFAVTYELNVYAGEAHTMLELYHQLHRQILDVFNEYRHPDHDAGVHGRSARTEGRARGPMVRRAGSGTGRPSTGLTPQRIGLRRWALGFGLWVRASAEGRDERTAVLRFTHRNRQVRGETRLQDVADSPGRPRRQHQVVFVVNGEEHHRGPGASGSQACGNFEAGHAGHRDVEDDDVGMERAFGLERREAILHGADNDAVPFQYRGGPREDLLVVVDEQHAGCVRQCDS